MKLIATLMITVLIGYKAWHLNELIEFKKLTITLTCKYENYDNLEQRKICTDKRIKNIDYLKFIGLTIKNF